MITTISHALTSGSVLDTFEIRSVLGTGGGGITYRAFDLTLERDVALKEYIPHKLATRAEDGITVICRSNDSEEEFSIGLRRFLREARTLAKFIHPAIVQVLRHFKMNGTAYLVMDYEQGESLKAKLQRTHRLLESDILRLFRPIMDGLELIHAAGYLHLDIKPSNIWLRNKRSSVLLDFGAAMSTVQTDDDRIPMVLTPRYAPAEQYQGYHKLGPWSDIYSLGACFFHCMTGTAPPIATDRIRAIAAEAKDDVEQQLWQQEQYSDKLKKIVCWLLKPRIGERPSSVDQVLVSLYGRGAQKIASNATTMHYHQQLDAELIAKAAQILAEHFGPSAKLMADTASMRADSAQEFLDLLSAQLPDETIRNRFAMQLLQ